MTADGGAHWSLMRAPRVWLDNAGSRGQQVNRVLFADRSDGWLYDQYNTRVVWATHDGGASWQETTLPGNVQTMAAFSDGTYLWRTADGVRWARYVAFLYASPGGMFHTGMKVMISFNGGRNRSS